MCIRDRAKGLLSQMLSLPEDWDYTLVGLSLINQESIDAIRTAVCGSVRIPEALRPYMGGKDVLVPKK